MECIKNGKKEKLIYKTLNTNVKAIRYGKKVPLFSFTMAPVIRLRYDWLADSFFLIQPWSGHFWAIAWITILHKISNVTKHLTGINAKVLLKGPKYILLLMLPVHFTQGESTLPNRSPNNPRKYLLLQLATGRFR